MIAIAPESVPYLSDYLNQQYVLARRNVAGTLQQKQISVKLLERFAGCRLRLNEVTTALLNAWIAELSKTRSPATVHAKRKDIMAILRQAYEDEVLVTLLRAPRAVRLPRPCPRAWTPAQVRMVIAVAASHRRGLVLAATLWLLWDTCCRVSAIYNAAPDKLDLARRGVWLLEPKTGNEDFYPLGAECLAALARLPADRKRLCGATVKLRRMRIWLDNVLTSAGFESDRNSKFHRFRKSKYTEVVRKKGVVAASKHARHTSTAMARSYLDTSLVEDIDPSEFTLPDAAD